MGKQGYYSQVLNNSNFQYSKAQAYYVNLKKAMQKTIEISLQKKLKLESQKIAQKYAEQLMQSLQGGYETDNDLGGSNSGAIARLDEIANKAFRDASNTSKGMRQILQNAATQVTKDMREYKAKYNKDVQDATKSFLGRLQTQLKSKGMEVFLENQKKGIYQAAIHRGESKEVAQQLSSYYLRVYLDKVLKASDTDTQSFFGIGKNKYHQALKGYLLEEAKTDGLAKATNKLLSSLANGTNEDKDYKIVINIGGKNTASDLAFNIANIVPDSYQVTAQGLASVKLQPKDIERLLMDSVQFGAQIKSYQSTKDGWKLPVLQIGSRAELRNQFLNNQQYQHNSITASIAFLGQAENIKEALGFNNVMFIAGKDHYWMDDFIKTFRARQYYLTFDYKQSKGKKVISSEVILYQWHKKKNKMA